MDRLRKKEDAICPLDVPWKYLTVKSVSKSVSIKLLMVFWIDMYLT